LLALTLVAEIDVGVRRAGFLGRFMLVVVAVAAFSFTLWVYTLEPYVYGIDGPYYLVQYLSLRDRLELEYPDPPLVFLLLYPFERVTDAFFGDPGFGLKVGVSFFTAVTAVLIYCVARRLLAGEVIVPALLALTYVVWPQTLRLETDFIKNSVSFLFIVLLAYALINDSLGCRARAALGVVAAICASLTHVMGFALAWVAIITYLTVLLIQHRRDARSLVRDPALPALLALVALTVATLAWPPLIGGDLRRFSEFLSAVGARGLGGGFGHGLVKPSPNSRASPSFACVEPALYYGMMYLLALTSLVTAILRKDLRLRYVALLSAVALAVLNVPAYPAGWGFRLRLASCLFVPLALTAVTAGAGRRAVKFAHVFLGFFLAVAVLGASVAAHVLGPSLPPPAIDELKTLNHYVPKGSEVFVPHVGVRYWFEALHYGEYVILKRPPPPGSGAYVVTTLRGPHPPPVARVVYEGRFFEVFKLP